LLALLAILLPLNILIEVKVMLYIFVFTSLVFTVRNYSNTLSQQRVFRWHQANEWIETTNESDVVWSCQPGAMMTPWFMIVTLKNGNDKESIFIGADQCDKQLYRRLLVRLKYLTNPPQEVEANSMDSS